MNYESFINYLLTNPRAKTIFMKRLYGAVHRAVGFEFYYPKVGADGELDYSEVVRWVQKAMETEDLEFEHRIDEYEQTVQKLPHLIKATIRCQLPLPIREEMPDPSKM